MILKTTLILLGEHSFTIKLSFVRALVVFLLLTLYEILLSVESTTPNNALNDQIKHIITTTPSNLPTSSISSSIYPIISTGLYPYFLIIKFKTPVKMSGIQIESNNLKKIEATTTLNGVKYIKELNKGFVEDTFFEDQLGEGNRQLFTLTFNQEFKPGTFQDNRDGKGGLEEIKIKVESGWGDFSVFWRVTIFGEIC